MVVVVVVILVMSPLILVMAPLILVLVPLILVMKMHHPLLTSHLRMQTSQSVTSQIFFLSQRCTVHTLTQQEPVDNVSPLQFPLLLNTSPPLNLVDPLADSSALGLTRSPKGFSRR